MNEIGRQLATVKTKTLSLSKQKRAAETRTKIEYGGLVHRSPLPAYLGLKLGDSLHDNPENWEKEAIILGALIEAYHTLVADSSGEVKKKYRFLGEKSLKYGKIFG